MAHLTGCPLADANQPCTKCGSRQNTPVKAGAAAATVAAASVGVELTYGEVRPWQDQWRTVVQQLEVVETACEPGVASDTDVVRRGFDAFFTQCAHVADWVGNDPATTHSFDEVRKFVESDPALRVCLSVANTSKHHTRTGKNAMTARIESIASDSAGIKARISWTEGQDNGNEDALDLARRCVAAWQGYLERNGLDAQD